jgi:hypothetical protein
VRRYEGRFGGNTSKLSADELAALQPTSFPEYVRNIRDQYLDETRAFKSRRVWLSVENYYIKTLTNRYRDATYPVTEADYELAWRILSSFDAIVITEWMANMNQTLYINQLLGDPDLAFMRRNEQKKFKEDPSQIDDDTLDMLYELNYWDIKVRPSFDCKLAPPALG